jgi:hypothetical protein
MTSSTNVALVSKSSFIEWYSLANRNTRYAVIMPVSFLDCLLSDALIRIKIKCYIHMYAITVILLVVVYVDFGLIAIHIAKHIFRFYGITIYKLRKNM